MNLTHERLLKFKLTFNRLILLVQFNAFVLNVALYFACRRFVIFCQLKHMIFSFALSSICFE